jgi:hypothetical protein
MDRRRLIILLFIVILFVSCRSVKYVPVERTVTRTETTVDTIVEYKIVQSRDSVATQDTASYLANDYCYSWAVIRDGVLHHSLVTFPKVILIDVPKTVIETTVSEPKIVTVEREKTFWEKAELTMLRLWFVLSLIAMGGYAAYRLIKRYKNKE